MIVHPFTGEILEGLEEIRKAEAVVDGYLRFEYQRLRGLRDFRDECRKEMAELSGQYHDGLKPSRRTATQQAVASCPRCGENLDVKER